MRADRRPAQIIESREPLSRTCGEDGRHGLDRVINVNGLLNEHQRSVGPEGRSNRCHKAPSGRVQRHWADPAAEGCPRYAGSTMAADPVVLAALVKALEADPESAPIRLHLAALLIESGGEASAMDHVLQVLNRDPTNVEAIGLAAQAARPMAST